jgi:hypothetical protein
MLQHGAIVVLGQGLRLHAVLRLGCLGQHISLRGFQYGREQPLPSHTTCYHIITHCTAGEDAWKDALIGMGLAPEVPKLFRHAGKVRNKHLSKRDTEKLVKELWKERMADPAAAAGRAPDLVDFVGAQLQKRLGIAAAVVEMGYNFLYGLWAFKWDADCELFLRILTGETPEDVYIAQVRLQSELEDLFAALDRAKGTPTGILNRVRA